MMKTTEEEREQIFFEDHGDFELVEEDDWQDEGKFSNGYRIFEHTPTGKTYGLYAMRHGDAFSFYDFDFPDDLEEVKQVTEYKKLTQWVGAGYEPKNEEPPSPTRSLIALPENGLSNAQQWVHYKRAENLAKDKQKELSVAATKEINEQDNILVQDDGKLQYIESSAKKPKDSIKSFLHDKGYLDMCKKDEIDLKKVQDLVDAKVLSQEEIDEHVAVTPKKYLAFKTNKK